MPDFSPIGGGVKRGDDVAYCKEPGRKLKAISDPWRYGSKLVVTARTCEKDKKKRTCGLYAVEALVPWDGGSKPDGAKKSDRKSAQECSI